MKEEIAFWYSAKHAKHLERCAILHGESMAFRYEDGLGSHRNLVLLNGVYVQYTACHSSTDGGLESPFEGAFKNFPDYIFLGVKSNGYEDIIICSLDKVDSYLNQNHPGVLELERMFKLS